MIFPSATHAGAHRLLAPHRDTPKCPNSSRRPSRLTVSATVCLSPRPVRAAGSAFLLGWGLRSGHSTQRQAIVVAIIYFQGSFDNAILSGTADGVPVLLTGLIQGAVLGSPRARSPSRVATHPLAIVIVALFFTIDRAVFYLSYPSPSSREAKSYLFVFLYGGGSANCCPPAAEQSRPAIRGGAVAVRASRRAPSLRLPASCCSFPWARCSCLNARTVRETCTFP